MVTIALVILLTWFFLSSIDAIRTLVHFKKVHKKNNELTAVEKKVAGEALDYLDSHPEVKDIITNIINYEASSNEKLQTKAKILRAKLKIAIQSPVLRAALYYEIKKR